MPVPNMTVRSYNPMWGTPFPVKADNPVSYSTPGGGASGSVWADTEGRANELRTDPAMMAAMQYLRGVMGGQNLPYSDQSMNAMRAQNSRGTAAAEAAQVAMLREGMAAGGGSVYDPSFQAAERELMSQRQGRNLDYAGQLQAQASQANFDARQRAASGYGQMALAQNAQINALLGQGAGYRAQEFTEQYRPPAPLPQMQLPGGWESYAQPTGGTVPGAEPPLTSFQRQDRLDSARAGSQPMAPAASAAPGAMPPAWGSVTEGTPQAGTVSAPPQPYQPPAPRFGPVQTYGMEPTVAYKPMTTYATRRTA